MKLIKIILLTAGIILIAIQFLQPSRNKNEVITDTDISKVLSVPDNVRIILKGACYDCHSNNTNYPWYSNIQPIGWYLANHIIKAKEDLNFSEFGGYSSRIQESKLNAIADEITDNGMPLPSYRLLHKNARLGGNEKILLTNWAQHSAESLPEKQ
jgi:hypothetical protein